MNNGKSSLLYLLGGIPNANSFTVSDTNSDTTKTEFPNETFSFYSAIPTAGKVNNSNNKTNSKETNLSEYSLDKKVTSVLGTTKSNSKERESLLNGLAKSGQISKDEKRYLMGV